VSWLNAERSDAMGLFWPKNSPTKTAHSPIHTYRHSDYNSLGCKKKKKRRTQSGTEHATLIFIDFILTPKKANAWKLNRCRSRDPRCHAPRLSLGRPETT